MVLTRSALLLVCVLSLAPRATAQSPGDTPPAEPVRREILALYDSREEPRPDQTRIHRFAEMPLNHLGLVVTYWDVNAGLPPRGTHGECPRRHHLVSAHAAARVLSVGARPGARRAFAWSCSATADCLRRTRRSHDANRLFAEIGFRMSGGFVDLTYGARFCIATR